MHFLGTTKRHLAIFTVAVMVWAGSALAQKTVKLDGDDNYSTQTLTVGDKMIVKLGVDRSSGYSWHVEPIEGGVLQEDAVKPRATPSNQVFEFTAAAPGVITLTLNNVRKADPSKPLQIYQVMVGVSSLPGQAKPEYVVGRFVGPMPCADCNGIEVDLTLYAHAPNQFVDTIYKRTTKYLGKEKTVSDTGTWALLPGTAADPSATVYAITPDGGGQVQYYWLKTVEELVPLDADKKPMSGPIDETMLLQK